jgi:tetratricopeptide (TPR) repeat protein
MSMYGKQIAMQALLIAVAGVTVPTALAQMPGQPQPGQQQQPPNPNQPAPLTLDAAPPVSAEEDAAIKSFRDEQDDAKKAKLADDFVQKYPQSRYLPEIYYWQVRAYYRKGDVEKMEATADKQLAVFPNDPQTLALVGNTIPRAWNNNLPPEQKDQRLQKAEKYSQKALDLLPTIPKPDGMADDKFQQLKNETLSMAYGGLGLVAYRRGKFTDAVQSLEKAVKANPQQPDPVNYYVLAKADEQTSHFDDAVVAFTKCAAIASGIKDTCAHGIDEAKKLGATQLSSPK